MAGCGFSRSQENFLPTPRWRDRHGCPHGAIGNKVAVGFINREGPCPPARSNNAFTSACRLWRLGRLATVVAYHRRPLPVRILRHRSHPLPRNDLSSARDRHGRQETTCSVAGISLAITSPYANRNTFVSSAFNCSTPIVAATGERNVLLNPCYGPAQPPPKARSSAWWSLP